MSRSPTAHRIATCIAAIWPAPAFHVFPPLIEPGILIERLNAALCGEVVEFDGAVGGSRGNQAHVGRESARRHCLRVAVEVAVSNAGVHVP